MMNPIALALLLPASMNGDSILPDGKVRAPNQEVVDIVRRDSDGVPQIYATSDAGAFYGAGYAVAEDRLFQMEIQRRFMRGRLAEVLDPANHPRAEALDVRARVLQWGFYADRAEFSLPVSEEQTVLEAFVAGINAVITDRNQNNSLPPMFGHLGMTVMEPWTVADSILMWWRVREQFGTNWGAETKACSTGPDPVVDLGGAVVQGAFGTAICKAETDERVRKILQWNPLGPLKASQNLVVSGSNSANGKGMMLGMPRHPLADPGYYYEFAVTSQSFAVRGVSVPGYPGMLHCWNADAGVTMSSMGADRADLYELDVDLVDPDTYYIDGTAFTMSSRPEVVTRFDGSQNMFDVRSSVWGPVVTPILSGTGNGQFALHHVIHQRFQHLNLESMLDLMRMDSWCAYRAALRKWEGPALHSVYADRFGDIAYNAIAKRPIKPTVPCSGNVAHDGGTFQTEWSGFYAFESLPWLHNPPEGYIVTGNNLAADPALTQGEVLGFAGDTVRSMRLRELITEALAPPGSTVNINDLRRFQLDVSLPTLRVFAKLAATIQQNHPLVLSPDANAFAQLLGQWNASSGATGLWQMRTSHPAFAVLLTLAQEPFRSDVPASITDVFGSGGTGFTHFARVIEQDVAAWAPRTDIQTYVNGRLERSLQRLAAFPDPAKELDSGLFTTAHQANFIDTVPDNQTVQEDYASGDSLNPAADVTENVDSVFIGTLYSPITDPFTFAVDFNNVNVARARLSPGVAEASTAPAPERYRNHITEWSTGGFYFAPLDRAVVESQANTLTQVMF